MNKMILQEATYFKFGYYPYTLKPYSNKRILAACDGCGEVRTLHNGSYRALCKSCAHKAKKGNKASNWQGEPIKRICEVCGNIFYVPLSVIYKGKGVCCSKLCADKLKKGKYAGEKSGSWKGGKVERVCKVCGKTFFARQCQVKKGYGNYCSLLCAHKDRSPWNKNIHCTAEHKRKISDSNKGKTAWNKGKLSVIKKDRHPNFGKRGKEAFGWRGGEKEARGRAKAKHRLLGFIPINAPFESAEGHHLTHNVVAFIPAWTHQAIRHNMHNGKNMLKINAFAIKFLLEGF